MLLTHNRVDEAVAAVERLLALPERPRIVVVDNASPDGTAGVLCQRFPALTCIRLAANVGGAGRNAGVQACERPYVAFCDDDTWWEPGGLARAADLFDAHPRLAVVTGKVLVGESERLDPASAEMARSPLRSEPEIPGRALVGFMAGASVVRRAAFLAVGGFERRFMVGGEEELLALDLLAAGWALRYVEELVVHHYPSPNRDDAARRWIAARNAL